MNSETYMTYDNIIINFIYFFIVWNYQYLFIRMLFYVVQSCNRCMYLLCFFPLLNYTFYDAFTADSCLYYLNVIFLFSYRYRCLHAQGVSKNINDFLELNSFKSICFSYLNSGTYMYLNFEKLILHNYFFIQGYTALHLAAMHGHEKIIELLVSTYSKSTLLI